MRTEEEIKRVVRGMQARVNVRLANHRQPMTSDDLWDRIKERCAGWLESDQERVFQAVKL